MEEGRNRKWLKISCIGCFGLPCLSILVTLCAVKVQINRIGNQMPGELAALQSMGIPTEPVDLRANPPVSDHENAKFLLDEIISDLSNLQKNKPYQDAREAYRQLQGKAPETDSATLRGLSFVLPTLKKLDSVNRFQHLDFKRDASLGADLQFAGLGPLREVAKWQSVRSRLLVRQGHIQESLKALQSIFVLARLVAQDPFSYSVSIAMNVDEIGHTALANHLLVIEKNEQALGKARAMLELLESSLDAQKPLFGEFILGRVSVQKLRSWQSFSTHCYGSNVEEEWDSVYVKEQDVLDHLTLGDPAVRRMFEAKHLEVWRKAFAQMPKDSHDWKGVGNAMETVAKTIEADPSKVNELNQIFFPYSDQFSKTFGMFQARYRLSLLSIRLLQDRSRGLPADLIHYGELAIDPMDDHPIRYTRHGNGFKIWSVGRDGIDQHGVKYYPYTGMSSANVDEVMYFSYPEKVPPLKAFSIPTR